MIITLTPDIEKVLVEQAHKLGTTPEQLALKSLRERFVLHVSPAIPIERQDTLADFLSGHIGVLHSSEHMKAGKSLLPD